jgi:hypothetical protein
MQKLAPFAQVGGKGQNLYRDTILVGAAIVARKGHRDL